MEKKVYLVDEKGAGTRLDLFLAAADASLTRSFWQKLCRLGYIFVEGKKEVKPATRLKKGQRVEAFLPLPVEQNIEPQDIALKIVYEDRDLLLVNKPRGMVVHPAAGNPDGTLVNALLAHCGALPAVGDRRRPGLVHRLDKDTSGLLVVAKNEMSFLHLSAQLKARKMKREYHGIVYGFPPAEKGTIDLPLGRDERNRKKFAVKKDGGGRQAITHYKVLKRVDPYALLLLRLETGRTHQIRVHLSYLGCPLVGDPLYGTRRASSRGKGQLLHARTLGFVHPRSKEYLEFTAEPEEGFYQILNQGGKDGVF
ncbi:MAG: RluA family pseudouridine synthase [Dethiobacteria bacterium]|jgi:23S rRNA pseudouridine1911/1915/1917 synthase